MGFTVEDIDLITHVGAGTPMGEMLRRYWVPAMLADELPVPDGTPKALRLLGEDLVAFRDSEGRVGIMDIHCPHRLSSLALGRNEEGGLRCLYHGWKLDVNGRVLETPCELPNSRLRDHVVHTAYPVREEADLIWVYMGPRELVPPLPDFNWMRLPSRRRAIGKMWEKCNFIQGMEGVFDSYHTNVLHSGYEVLHWSREQIAEVWQRPSRATHGVTSFEDTSYGYHYGAVRQPSRDADRLDYVRVTEYVAPYYCINPPDLGAKSAGFFFVPIDDRNTMLYQVSAAESDDREIDVTAARRQMSMLVGEDLDESFRPWRNETNGFGQNRDLMLAGRSPDGSSDLRALRNAYTGIDTGVQTQDMAMVETMGSIADRTKEHLGASDVGIVHWRERLINAVKDFARGLPAPGLDPAVPYHEVAAVGALVEKGTDWRRVAWTAQEGRAPISDDSSVIAAAGR